MMVHDLIYDHLSGLLWIEKKTCTPGIKVVDRWRESDGIRRMINALLRYNERRKGKSIAR